MDLGLTEFDAAMLAAAEKLRTGERQLVHYTSGENALNIIQGREFWLRNVRCMNDFSEVNHGIDVLVKKLTNENNAARRDRFVAAIDRIAPGVANKAIGKFDDWSFTLRHRTFIGCLSLISPNDHFGKLSMWRAYCPSNAGVALVMNATPFLAETDELNAFSVPVSYINDEQFTAQLDGFIDQIESITKQLSPISNDAFEDIETNIFWFFIKFALSLKHPAFSEEEEWRIFCIPEMFPSKTIKEGIATIGGVPQLVQKIPLEDSPSKGLHKADIPNLIKRIIIGPTEYPLVIRDALAKALENAGVSEPLDRIEISNIPLR